MDIKMTNIYGMPSTKFWKLKDIVFLLALIIFTLTGEVNPTENGGNSNNSSEVMRSIQLGILQAVGSQAKVDEMIKPKDYLDKISIKFPARGSGVTPAHHFQDFTFTTYSPKVFKYFRKLAGVDNADFMLSLCNLPLKGVGSGGSGALFFITEDDKFIVKTVKNKEAKFLQEILPKLSEYLKDNPDTLLSKFLGLYGYTRHFSEEIIIVMKNLLPSSVKFHKIYDLKGSTVNRNASISEKQKKNPTFKDNDFKEHHPDGIYLEDTVYKTLSQRIKRDCEFLESLEVTDYSLLLGIHNINQAAIENTKTKSAKDQTNLSRTVQLNQSSSTLDRFANGVNVSQGGIPAVATDRDKLLLYVGIIDILTYFGKLKSLEFFYKASTRGDAISLQKPSIYAQRFHNFMTNSVFTKTDNPYVKPLFRNHG